MNKTAFQALRSVFFRAFSLVELMVTLIVISCIISALVPSITKKLKSQAITVGSGGGGNTNLEFEQDCSAFGVDCALCFEDRCAMCAKSCEDDEFVNTPQCICESCTTKSENCITCTSKGCTKCTTGYGLSNTRICQQCQETQYSDGANPCTTCPENHYCNGSVSIACPSDSYAPAGSTSCTLCSETYSNCATCNSSECLTCKKGYKLKDNTCIIASGSKTFTTAGTHEFSVPEGVDELTVTLVSGGAGGGGGKVVTKTETFVTSGSGNSANDADNILHVDSSGLFTWTIPAAIRGKNVKVDACGGGGGGGSNSAGGRGGIINVSNVPMPNQKTIGIIIGGGGGGKGKNGACAYGGAGGNYWDSSYNYRSTSCGASGSWGAGGQWKAVTAYGGYDPIFNEHGVGGGSGGSSGGGKGSRVGGGGGAGGSENLLVAHQGGGGGGATLFKNNTLAMTQAYVAPGGGGGAPTGKSGSGAGGGGGGGIGGGAGASAPGSSTKTAPAGKAGTGSGTNVFGSNYCAGGSAGSTGKSGAMRITYYNKTPGTGGGAGHIVPKQKIPVIEGQILTIIVGAGGAGGNVGSNGVGAHSGMVSKIINSDGITLLSSAPSVSSMGATGGNYDGTSVGIAGWINNGTTATKITMSGFSNTNGEAISELTGGKGGSTTIESLQTLCSPGDGGNGIDKNGSDATGFGGCGGGGAGAGGKGGAGAPGYVKISWGEE